MPKAGIDQAALTKAIEQGSRQQVAHHSGAEVDGGLTGQSEHHWRLAGGPEWG